MRAAMLIQAAPQLSRANPRRVIRLRVGMGTFPMPRVEGREGEVVGRSPIVRTATHPIIGRYRRGWDFDSESEKKTINRACLHLSSVLSLLSLLVYLHLWLLLYHGIEASSPFCEQFIPEEQAVLLSYLVSYPIRYAVFITLIPTVAITRSPMLY